jgi:hypothetical protein
VLGTKRRVTVRTRAHDDLVHNDSCMRENVLSVIFAGGVTLREPWPESTHKARFVNKT